MRAAVAILIFLMGLNNPLHAATFSCEFFAPVNAGGTCTIQSTKVNACGPDYSAVLAARCRGREYGDQNSLVCYFAAPATLPNLDRYLDDPKGSPETRFKAPPTGTFAIATELVTPAAATDMQLAYTDDRGSTYYVLCRHQ
jgi:hypothetical protein